MHVTGLEIIQKITNCSFNIIPHVHLPQEIKSEP